jgi:hypothetical protein
MNRQDEAGETIEPHRRRLFLVTMTADVAPEGLRKFDVKEWMLMECSMTVTLNFAERTLDVA